MAFTKLVKTILCHGDNKYEVYAVGENASVDRIIHYKLRTCSNKNGVDGKSESQWRVFNSHVPIPQDPLYKNASNVEYYLEKL